MSSTPSRKLRRTAQSLALRMLRRTARALRRRGPAGKAALSVAIFLAGLTGPAAIQETP